MSSNSSSSVKPDGLTRWETLSQGCKKDVSIKITLVVGTALVNMAAVVALFYYIVSYTSIPTQALVASPFIVGVLAAVSNMKLPTFGISTLNYTNYTNPLALIGRVASYILFGPLKYIVKRTDLKLYHDPICANRISDTLCSLPFEKVAKTFGRHFSHLVDYGFIDQQHKAELETLYQEYLIQKRTVKAFEGVNSKTEAATQKMVELSQRWETLKNQFKDQLPHPDMPHYDLSKFQDRFIVKVRRWFGINAEAPTITTFEA